MPIPVVTDEVGAEVQLQPLDALVEILPALDAEVLIE